MVAASQQRAWGMHTHASLQMRCHIFVRAPFPQYFVCRVLLGTYFTAVMAHHLLVLEPHVRWWGVAAVAAFSTLCLLNYAWMAKLVRKAAGLMRSKPRPSAEPPATRAAPQAAAAAAVRAPSVHATVMFRALRKCSWRGDGC